jgi:hypothetical protein
MYEQSIGCERNQEINTIHKSLKQMCLAINLTDEVKDFYSENYKTLKNTLEVVDSQVMIRYQSKVSLEQGLQFGQCHPQKEDVVYVCMSVCLCVCMCVCVCMTYPIT